MQKNRNVFSVLLIATLAVLGLSMTGCTSTAIVGTSESAMVFPDSGTMPVQNVIKGSYTYNSKTAYIIKPDGSLISAPTTDSEKKSHEAYVFSSEVSVDYRDSSKSRYVLKLKEGYRFASADDMFELARQTAATNAGITELIAVRSYTETKLTSTLFFFTPIKNVYSQDITVLVYGKP